MSVKTREQEDQKIETYRERMAHNDKIDTQDHNHDRDSDFCEGDCGYWWYEV